METKKKEKIKKMKGFFEPWCGVYRTVKGMSKYAIYKNGVRLTDDVEIFGVTVHLKLPKGYTIKKI